MISIEIPEYPKVPIMKEVYDGRICTLKPPSWDCGWYWGWGYLGNRDLHTHWDSVKSDYNKNQDKKEHLYCLVDIDGDNYKGNPKYQSIKWELEDLMESFYTLKGAAALYNRGGSNFSGKDRLKELHNEDAWLRINTVEIPAIFKRFYELVDSVNELVVEEEV